MAHTEQERVLYEAREKALRDERSRLAWYEKQRTEGRQEGRLEGLEEGRRKTRLIARINVRQVQLGNKLSSPDELFESTEEELLRLLDSLEKSAE